MNENINLCELLEGHEGETFYSPLFGDVAFLRIKGTGNPIVIDAGYSLSSNGKANINGECMLFPSKDQRDWNKWAKEQKPKVPKTWEELCQSAQIEGVAISTDIAFNGDKTIDNSHAVSKNDKLAKSALALLKIYQLIEVGYGGNITDEEWNNRDMMKYTIKSSCNSIVLYWAQEVKTHIAFHTEKQRKEFLSYPENVQLVKDFYIIP